MLDFCKMKGKHVLITGGGSGIGRQTAIVLDELGAKVTLIGSTENKLIDSLSLLKGKEHSFYVTDLSQIDLIEPLLLNIIKEKGGFDGFVHSAGIVKNLPLVNYKFERLHKIMLVNFYSFFEIVRILSKKGRFNSGMSIVGVSSVAATQEQLPKLLTQRLRQQ